MMGKDKNKDKEHQDGQTATSGKSITSPWDTHQSNRDLNQDREARDTALANAMCTYTRDQVTEQARCKFNKRYLITLIL